MNIDIAALRAIEADKGIPIEMVINTIQSALLTAYRHTDGHQPNARIDIDRKTGVVRVMALETDQDGNVISEWDDTPEDFGRIAATNAISDIYAMGGRPIMALAILGMPIDKLPPEMIREILDGGRSICAEAGIPVAGGHSIDAPEPIYGLAVIGLCHPSELRRNADARPGDALILTKGLGVGIYSAAIKKGAYDFLEKPFKADRLPLIGGGEQGQRRLA